MRRSRLGSAIVAAAVTCAAAACSFVTSLDGLTGGSGTSPDSSAGDDATTTTADGSVINPGGNDGAPLGDDSAAGDDGGSQTLDAGDAGAFCASQSPAPAFCDDFDEDPSDAAAFLAPWNQVTQMGGSVVRATKPVMSPPLSMLSTADSPVTDSIDLAAYKSFSPAVTKSTELTLAFDLFVAGADKTNKSDAVLAAIELNGGLGQRWALQLEVSYDVVDGGAGLDVVFSENRSNLDSGAGYTSHPVSQRLPLGAWTRVTMEATVAPFGSATIALHFGTTEVAKDTITLDVLDGVPEILVGLTYASVSNEGWAVAYDNVTFDLE